VSGRTGGAGRTAVRIVAVVLVLGAVAWVDGRLPTREQELRPFVATGSVSEVVTGRRFSATVTGVAGSATLTGAGTVHTSDGVWLDITVRLEAGERPATIRWAVVRDRAGSIYPATSRIIQPLVATSTLEPGIPLIGHVYVEVPAARVAGSSIQLSTEAYDRRLDSVLRIDLGLDAAAARGFTDAGGLTLVPTRVVG
jgi:hypothetical protein